MAEPYISQIIMFGGNYSIRQYANCDGQLLPISQNQALFSLLGTTYGGDGRTSFGLPDLRGRVPTAQGQGPGLTPYPLGSRFGVEDVTLTVNQLPSHTHAAMANSGSADSPDPTNRLLAPGTADGNAVSQFSDQSPTANMSSAAVQRTGGSQSHTNMMPSLVINFQIALQGLFPSRS
ncbi:phage tail protein [Rhodovibrio sodomensis]|uniref:Phage tail protein n=1 Tax=Rhodovibrio sodomensis TaxID=1088 RepID=A0ABS1DJI9_9PROT|nr:tail fiber protein [Rhodovibrio sodomensis]MBK1670379.1 phage tail protein [Rhodovibrio sodomensis]